MSPLDISVLIAIAGLLILASVAVLNIVSLIGKGWMKAAVIPYAQKGILAGEKLAIEGLKQVDAKLTGADKAAIANSVYDNFPEWIALPGLPIPIHIGLVKAVISRDQFKKIVEDEFRAADAYIQNRMAYFARQTDALAALSAKG